MHATSIVTGDRLNGLVRVTLDGLTFAYAYHRGTGRARHDLTIWPSGGALASSPRLVDVLHEIAVQSAEAGVGDYAWSIEEDRAEWVVAAIAERAA